MVGHLIIVISLANTGSPSSPVILHMERWCFNKCLCLFEAVASKMVKLFCQDTIFQGNVKQVERTGSKLGEKASEI